MKKGYLDEHGVMQFPTPEDAIFRGAKAKYKASLLIKGGSRQRAKSKALDDMRHLYEKGYMSWESYWNITDRIYKEFV